MSEPEKSGLSFTEIVVAVVILVVLTGLLAPSVEEARRNRLIGCMNNTRMIMLACKQYAIDNGDEFPFHPNDVGEAFLILTSGNYISPGRFFVCSNNNEGRSGNPLHSTNVSYAYVSGLTEKASSDWPLVMDRGITGARTMQPATNLIGQGWVDWGNVAYVGGQLKASRTIFDPTLLKEPEATNAIALFPAGTLLPGYAHTYRMNLLEKTAENINEWNPFKKARE